MTFKKIIFHYSDLFSTIYYLQSAVWHHGIYIWIKVPVAKKPDEFW